MTTRRKPSEALTRIVNSLDEETLHRTRDRMLVVGRIADILKAKGLSQRRFADMLGKSESEISELLSGNRNFGLDTLSDISKCLKVDFLQLSGITATQVSNKDSVVKLPRTGKPEIYDMNDVKTVYAVMEGWQTYPSAGYLSLAL